ncbi:hypothetical protein BJX65DRAFT_303702 [Aspergillus insuetus]
MNSFVAKVLDDAGIPNFIWAEPFLSVIGILTAVPFNAFVVADNLIEKSAEALNAARFPQCTQGHGACTVLWPKRDHPYPDYHWHTDLRYPVTAPKMTRGVFLYRKSRLFWKFPDRTLQIPTPNDPYYMLTSHRHIKHVRRGPHTGPASPEDYPVKMPVPARYLEAMMLLELRDTGEGMITAHWEVELDYLWNGIAQKNPNLRVTDLTQPWRVGAAGGGFYIFEADEGWDSGEGVSALALCYAEEGRGASAGCSGEFAPIALGGDDAGCWGCVALGGLLLLSPGEKSIMMILRRELKF